jgi:hypothetical protein
VGELWNKMWLNVGVKGERVILRFCMRMGPGFQNSRDISYTDFGS